MKADVAFVLTVVDLNVANLSPCIRICEIRNGRCAGCYRTLEEINNWASMNEAQQKEVLDKCCHRSFSHAVVHETPKKKS